MFIKENIMLAIAGLKSNKMRALLTMLGIIIGIASVIGVVLTYKEVKMEAEQEKKINKKIGKTNYENRTYCIICK